MAADAGLRLFVVLLAASGEAGQRESAWHLVMALFMLPCVLLAPINGAIGNSLPKRNVLVASAAWCLSMLLLFGVGFGAGGAAGDSLAGGSAQLGGALALAMVMMVGFGAAVFVPTRFAMLPAAAADCGVPLARVVSWIEAGAVLAMVGGMLMAGHLATAAPLPSAPATVWAIAGLALVSLLASIPAHFPSDVRRAEAPREALRGFFRDARRIATDRGALAPLAGLAAFRGIVAVAVGALVAMVLARQGDAEGTFQALLSVALLTMAGVAVGSVLAGLWHDGEQALAVVPVGATGLALALAWVSQAADVSLALCVVVGLLGGLMNVPLLVAYQIAVPADARGNGMAILNTAGYLSITLMSLLTAGLSSARLLTAGGQLIFVATLAAAAAASAWWWLRARRRDAAATVARQL